MTPPPAPDTSITDVTVTGTTDVSDSEAVAYSVAVSGDATPYTYTWSATNGSITAGQGTASGTVTWGSAGAGDVTCLVGSTNSNFDGNSGTDTLNVTVT